MKSDGPRGGARSSGAGAPVASYSGDPAGPSGHGFQRSQRKTGMIGPQNDRATASPPIA